MDFVPDCDVANKTIRCGEFSRYSEAYVITNEDLRESMGFMPKKCNHALTVAASGDHPLFASLYGAKHVDTFDISYNAKKNHISRVKKDRSHIKRGFAYAEVLNDLERISDHCSNISTNLIQSASG